MSRSTAIPHLRDADAPAFREPWQAKAFAIVVLLHRQGRFEWDAWVRVLAAEIAAAPQQAGEHPDAAYHRQFLAALERIVAALGIADRDAQQRRKEEWRRAYVNTPHGHAVELAAARSVHGDPHEHDLSPVVRPVAISPRQMR